MGQDQSKPPGPKLPKTIGEKFSDKVFPFENLVLEGGGAKGIAYIGTCKVLEDAGIMGQIKRFAGTSAGAITAALLAIGMTSQELLDELSAQNLLEVVLDTRWTKSSWIPGMQTVGRLWDVLNERGACPGEKFLEWFGDILERNLKKRGLPLGKDVTFDQIYHVLGKELCIVAYNMNYNRESYFHVKTTPVLRVREAVRMSMSIPVVFQPYELQNLFTYIDGGLAANFPLYAFDGWYLSMGKDDTFYKRLTSLTDDEEHDHLRRVFYPEYRWERFENQDPTRFDKTLGILIFSNSDREVYQDQFEERLRYLMNKDPSFKKIRPDTEKARNFTKQYGEQRTERDAGIKSFETLVDDRMRKLIELIAGPDVMDDVDGGTIDVPETPTMMAADEGFPVPSVAPPMVAMEVSDEPRITIDEARRHFFEIVKEEDVKAMQAPTKEAAFQALFLDVNGKLTVERVLNMYENYAPLQVAKRRVLGMRSVKTAGQYYGTLMDFVGSKNQISEEDIDRCIGVDVDYLSTMDFDMTPTDMEFLMGQGATAAVAYMTEYVEGKTLPSRSVLSPPPPPPH
ncbi:Hypp8813 [Branchiostoma lanceolatum]|uniref:Hypp8813 protein n=1 Tax=Branchiostoma lanceolatum TaxID=7740 RepID=A0A8J9ZAQ5_BRALA|nr:Hypp8813 [Branchiostoma lanceolatum]